MLNILNIVKSAIITNEQFLYRLSRIDYAFYQHYSSLSSSPPQGYHSPIREIEHIEVQPDAWLSTVLPTSTSMWLVLVPLAVVAALAGTVVYLVQRHRRLANSFSRFANSHYDTRTGATRIGDALDEDDHNNESPRFEDDEPLVIA